MVCIKYMQYTHEAFFNCTIVNKIQIAGNFQMFCTIETVCVLKV